MAAPGTASAPTSTQWSAPVVHTRSRRRLTATLLGEEAVPEPDDPSGRVARGVILDISPHMVCVATPRGEERFLFERSTSFWRGGDTHVSELRTGDDVVIRCSRDSRLVAERLWAQIARVTGVIAASSGDTLEVDVGHGQPRRAVEIPYRSSGRIGVRHPRLEPGYLFDAIGVWHDSAVMALTPAVTQPPYPVSHAPPSPRALRGTSRVRGTVTWYDPALGRCTHVNPLARLSGAAYPALDAASDCGAKCDRVRGCSPLPLLSIGTTFKLRDDCSGEQAVLPIVDCASTLSHFCDRCAECEGGGRGRVAQLTLTSFIAMGGRPETGCLNATLTMG